MIPEEITAPPVMPPRDPLGHKGSFGMVLVVGGHAGGDGRTYLGAPMLAAQAALRSGAGLAALAMPESILPFALEALPAATGIALPLGVERTLDASAAAERIDAALLTADAIVVGPGLGRGFAETQLVLRVVGQDRVPTVLDADGISLLAALPDFSRDLRAPLVLTPHPGEFARLAGPLAIVGDPGSPAERPRLATELARRLGAIVVLKGPGTVVSDGLRTWINPTGNAALATGGSGDVLAGLVGGLVAQFVRRDPAHRVALSLFDAARLAVYLHGLAADRWAAAHGDAGMLPTDLVALIPDVIAELRGR
jgi:NAD(P)H-hydrate epimerase